ncbi:hypothetical protein KSC_056070 [Ktedonobacter sp. SOSP1-52]|nr:hypothetical protein KSC_056070 [Ktedonobacter sp. SOSP1-52]
MYGGLGMNIFKGDDMIILVDNFARYLARDNFTEEAIIHQAYHLSTWHDAAEYPKGHKAHIYLVARRC